MIVTPCPKYFDIAGINTMTKRPGKVQLTWLEGSDPLLGEAKAGTQAGT